MENPLEHLSNIIPVKSARISISDSLKGQLPNASNFLSRFSLYRLNILNFDRIYTLYKSKTEEADKIGYLITDECDIELLKAFIKSNKFHGFFDNNVNESKLNELKYIVGNVNITKKSTLDETTSVDGNTSGGKSENDVRKDVDKIKTDLMSQVFSIGISKNIRELLDKAKKINSIEILKEVYELTMLIRLSHPQLRKALDGNIKYFIEKVFNKDPFYFHKNEELVFIKTQDEDSCYFSESHTYYFFLDNLENIDQSKLDSDSIEFNINDQFGNVSSIKSRRLITEYKSNTSFKLPSVLKEIITDKNTLNKDSLQSLLEKAILQSIRGDNVIEWSAEHTSIIHELLLKNYDCKNIFLTYIEKDVFLDDFYRYVLPVFIEELSTEQIIDITLKAIDNGKWLDDFYRYVLPVFIEELSTEQIIDITLKAIDKGERLNNFYIPVLFKVIDKLSTEQIKKITLEAIYNGFYQFVLHVFKGNFNKIFDLEYITEITLKAIDKGGALNSFYEHVLPKFIEKLLKENDEQNITYIKEIIDSALKKDTGLGGFYQFVLGNTNIIYKILEENNLKYIKEIIDSAIATGKGLDKLYEHVLPKVINKLPIEDYEQNITYIKGIIDSAIATGKGLDKLYEHVLPKVIEKFPEIFDIKYIKEIIDSAIKKSIDLSSFYKFVLPVFIDKFPENSDTEYIKGMIDTVLDINRSGYIYLGSFIEHVLPKIINKLLIEDYEQNITYIKGIIDSAIATGKGLDKLYEHVLPKVIDKLSADQVYDITLKAIDNGIHLYSFYYGVLSKVIDKLSTDQIYVITLKAIDNGIHLDSFYYDVLLSKVIDKLSTNQVYDITLKAIDKGERLNGFYIPVLFKVIDKLSTDQIYVITLTAIDKGEELGSFYISLLPQFIDKLLPVEIYAILKAIYNGEGSASFYYYKVLSKVIDKLSTDQIYVITLTAIDKGEELDSFYISLLPQFIDKLLPEQIKEITLKAIEKYTDLRSFYQHVLPVFIEKLLKENIEENMEYIQEIIKSALFKNSSLDIFYNYVITKVLIAKQKVNPNFKIETIWPSYVKRPVINFNPTGNEQPYPQININNNLKTEVPEEFAKFIGYHYNRISAILGLNQVDDNYLLSVDSLRSGILGEHQKPVGEARGKISISLELFEEACLEFINSNKVRDTEQTHTAILEVIDTLAHELYHRRQATFFILFHTTRRARYINPEDDYKGYMDQIIEVGARAFAKGYMKKLVDEFRKDDKFDLASSVRVFVEKNYPELPKKILSD